METSERKMIQKRVTALELSRFQEGPVMDNEMRINRAITAMEAAYPGEEDDLVSKIDDLLTDLMHLCRREEIEFRRCLTVAEVNFESEK
jgi:hypothetical protein